MTFFPLSRQEGIYCIYDIHSNNTLHNGVSSVSCISVYFCQAPNLDYNFVKSPSFFSHFEQQYWTTSCAKFTEVRIVKFHFKCLGCEARNGLKLKEICSPILFLTKPTRCTNFTNLFCHETLHVSESSSVHHQEFIHCTLSNGICHTGL